MKTCRRCGGVMLPQETGEKIMLICNSCGYREPAGEKKHRAKNSVLLVEERDEPAPTTHVICPSCGHDRAYWWMRQTRAADEPSTRFYKCVKCGKVWREYV